MKYSVIRTDLADSQIRSIILYIAENSEVIITKKFQKICSLIP